MSFDRELVAVEAPSLLVLRALGLGDLLTAVPALRGIARAFPEHRRMLAAPRALAPLVRLVRLADGSPAVHELLDLCLLAPGELARAAAQGGAQAPGGAHLVLGQARTGSFRPASRRLGAAVNLHGRGPQSHRLLLDARPERIIAFAHPEVPESWDGPRWRAGEHEVARWCRMLRESGIACDPHELAIDRPRAQPPPSAHGATVIHPGAGSPARRWPVGRWAAVAAAERVVGRRVLVTGSPAEAPLAQAVAAGAGLPPQAVLAGRTGVGQLAAVVAAAGRVVCGDTGIAHLATALGTPSVVLFGPTAPSEWGPPRSGRYRVLWAGTSGDPHGLSPDPGLLRIAVADVLSELERLERA